jgi:hypothetical protein
LALFEQTAPAMNAGECDVFAGLAWLLIAGGVAVIAGTVWLAFGIRNQAESKPVPLPGTSENWPWLSDSVSNKKKRDLDLQRPREQELADAEPVN